MAVTIESLKAKETEPEWMDTQIAIPEKDLPEEVADSNVHRLYSQVFHARNKHCAFTIEM